MIDVGAVLADMAAARRTATTTERLVRLGVAKDKIMRLATELEDEMYNVRVLMATPEREDG